MRERAGCAAPWRRAGAEATHDDTRQTSAAWAIASSAKKTHASCAARATTSTTSSCRACSTWTSCAAPTRTRRSPSIDTSKALALPGVLAVITGKDLDAAGLAWMPTLMCDKQMVLPVDRVVYQAQEVAAVIATERYIAADGIALVEVEYEPLPAGGGPVQGARGRLAAGAPRPRAEDQPHLALGGRRPPRRPTPPSPAPRSSSKRTSTSRASTSARSRPAAASPPSTRSSGKLTVYMTTQAPHAIRTVFSLVDGHPGAQDPRHLAGHRRRLRRQGAGLSRLRHRQRSPRSRPAVPVKWIEDRSENLQADSLRARLPHHTPSWPPTRTAR